MFQIQKSKNDKDNGNIIKNQNKKGPSKSKLKKSWLRSQIWILSKLFSQRNTNGIKKNKKDLYKSIDFLKKYAIITNKVGKQKIYN